MRKLVFVGNCQSQSLIHIYRNFICPITNDRLHFIHIHSQRTPAEEIKLQEADVIIQQLIFTTAGFNFDDMDVTARVIPFPQVSGRFLFPFGEVRHPLNKPIPYRPQGPFPSADTDSFINRMMAQNVAPDEAIRRYRDLDVVTAGELARLYKTSMMLQRNLDEECETDFATAIEGSFREEDCFHSTYHPKLPIFRHVVRHVFDALDVARPTTERILNSLGRTSFSLAEIPIHPGVAAYFGLKYYDAHARYRRFTGESVDTEAYWKDYIGYTWNNDLLVGISRAQEQHLTAEERLQLIDQLQRGISHSQGSPDASHALSILLDRAGRHDEALIAAQEAVDQEPTHSPFWTQLAKIFLRLSRAEAAEHAAREAIRTGPAYADAHRQLRQVLSFVQRWKEAASAAEDVIALAPDRDEDWRLLATLWERAGDPTKAEQVLQTARKHLPAGSNIMAGLAELRRGQDRFEEAVAFARMAVQANPNNTNHRWTLADCLIRSKRETEAEATLREAIAQFPKLAYSHKSLGDLLARQKRLPEAEHWLRQAAEMEPSFADSLANLLMQQKRFQEAHDLLRNVPNLERNPGALLALARICLASGDVEPAIAWAEKAASEPFHNVNAVRFVYDALMALPDPGRARDFLEIQHKSKRNVADINLLLARLHVRQQLPDLAAGH